MSDKDKIIPSEQIDQAEVDRNLSAIQFLSSLPINLSRDKRNENVIVFGDVGSGKEFKLKSKD